MLIPAGPATPRCLLQSWGRDEEEEGRKEGEVGKGTVLHTSGASPMSAPDTRLEISSAPTSRRSAVEGKGG